MATVTELAPHSTLSARWVELPKKRRDNGASLNPLLGSIQFVEGPTEHHRLDLGGRTQYRHPGLGLGGQWGGAIANAPVPS